LDGYIVIALVFGKHWISNYDKDWQEVDYIFIKEMFRYVK